MKKRESFGTAVGPAWDPEIRAAHERLPFHDDVINRAGLKRFGSDHDQRCYCQWCGCAIALCTHELSVCAALGAIKICNGCFVTAVVGDAQRDGGIAEIHIVEISSPFDEN